MTRFLLVRHAPPDPAWQPESRLCGWYDPPLGEAGRALAWTLADSLRRFEADAVYASPLQRAWQTAEPIARALALDLQPAHGLREISCGEVDGMRLNEVQARYPGHWERNLRQTEAEFRWPGGESYAEFRQRVGAGLDTLAARHDRESLIVVAHTGVVTQVFGMLHGWNAARWDRRRPEHAGITVVEWDGGRPLRVTASGRT